MKTIINKSRPGGAADELPAAARAGRPAGRPRRGSRCSATGLLALAAVGALAMTGCTSGHQARAAADDETLRVVASTSVYADMAREIGGDDVEVTAIIDSPAQDPHSYEATPLDALTVRDADLVIVNGGGYDSFMDGLLEGSEARVIDAVEVSGLEASEEADDEHDHDGHDHEEHSEDESAHEAHSHEGHDHAAFNEHVWYDLPSMERLSGALADGIGELAPEEAPEVTERGQQYAHSLHELGVRAEDLHLEGSFLATEPVADHLLERAGLHDATPEQLTAAVENGLDIPPLLYLEAEEALESGEADVLAYNEHTASGQTQRLQDTAEETGADVVSFTETVPEGVTYLEWMSANVDQLEEIR